jgi:glucosamine kinase
MKILVADSGGTRTDWCLTDQNSNMHLFETASYHPNEWTESFFEEQSVFWESYPNKDEINLYFFGAGCLNEDKQQVLRDFFGGFGFASVKVASDIHAAGYATIGAGNGAVAIMGTGSVLAIFDNGQVKELRGGLGYALGDEGSGYYFGKLVIENLLNGNLPTTEKALYALFGDRKHILSACYGDHGKVYISEVAVMVKNLNSSELNELHKDNIRLFCDKHVKHLSFNEISFCGSYGYYRQSDVREVLAEFGKSVDKIQERPILAVTEYLMKHAF